jgi:hypothetical protein
VLDRLDRYQKTAKVNQVYDEGARKKLFEKLNRVAANLGLAVIEDPAKAGAAPAPEAAAELAAPQPPAGEKEKMPWGGGRRKPLKRLDPEKRIQGNQGRFL